MDKLISGVAMLKLLPCLAFSVRTWWRDQSKGIRVSLSAQSKRDVCIGSNKARFRDRERNMLFSKEEEGVNLGEAERQWWHMGAMEERQPQGLVVPTRRGRGGGEGWTCATREDAAEAATVWQTTNPYVLGPHCFGSLNGHSLERGEGEEETH